MSELLAYLAIMITLVLLVWYVCVDLERWAKHDLPEKIDKWIEEAMERHR